MFSEWLYLPEAAAAFLCDPGVWLFLIGGVFLGFVVGVVPGLGPTMGMALCLTPTVWHCSWAFLWPRAVLAALPPA